MAIKNDGLIRGKHIGNGLTTDETRKKIDVAVDGTTVTFTSDGKLQASGVAVLTGEIADGGTLPIPSGFTESQCHFFVSMKYAGPNGAWWDWNENENVNGKQSSTECYVSGRTVTCQTIVHADGNGSGSADLGPPAIPGVANYLVIAVK